MRVVGGELGGRRLTGPPKSKGANLRPTTDRVREALFSALDDVADATVLDLFSGSGSLAIEALSRGAASAVLVDSDTGLLTRNVDALGVRDRCTIVRSDALLYLRRAGPRFDLVFCDPPYKLADRLGPRLDKIIPPRLAPGARLIVESSTEEPLTLSLPVIRRREYGSTALTIYGAPK